MRIRRMMLCLLTMVTMMLSGLALSGPALAQAPDYITPAGFSLPWAVDQGQRVTWGPADHWSYGKARGIAFDFALAVGTPLYAPTNGWIYYLSDERPFETNYGHYVEIVSEDSDWLIRLAHLRDPQTGEGPVRAGELIGHSGRSGVTAAHLHLELLMRQGDAWVRPDLERLTHLFGHPIEALTEEAIVTNQDGDPTLSLAGELVVPDAVTMGDELHLPITLRNTGLSALHLNTVQVALQHEQGQSVLAEIAGDWTLEPKAERALVAPVRLNRSGTWQVTGLTYQSAEADGHLVAQAAITVTAPFIRLASLDLDPLSCDTERPLVWRATLVNDTAEQQVLDGLSIEGRRPDGGFWQFRNDEIISLDPYARQVVTLTAPSLARVVGIWQMTDVAYLRQGEPFYLDAEPRAFDVQGPQLQVQALEVFFGEQTLYLLMTLGNVGTRAIHPDQIELWGWQPDESSFSATQQIRTALQPGTVARYLFAVPTHDLAGEWRLVEAGSWQEGIYAALPLPIEPTIVVPQPALASLLP